MVFTHTFAKDANVWGIWLLMESYQAVFAEFCESGNEIGDTVVACLEHRQCHAEISNTYALRIVCHPNILTKVCQSVLRVMFSIEKNGPRPVGVCVFT